MSLMHFGQSLAKSALISSSCRKVLRFLLQLGPNSTVSVLPESLGGAAGDDFRPEDVISTIVVECVGDCIRPRLTVDKKAGYCSSRGGRTRDGTVEGLFDRVRCMRDCMLFIQTATVNISITTVTLLF